MKLLPKIEHHTGSVRAQKDQNLARLLSLSSLMQVRLHRVLPLDLHVVRQVWARAEVDEQLNKRSIT